MAGERPGPRRAGRRLTDEESRLWARVAETARPLTRGRAAPEPAAAEPPGPAAEPPPTSARSPAGTAPRARPRPPALQPPLAGFEPREARALAGGRLAIDARVDLHGLTQRQAHARLRSFLAAAQARGHRRVLVITGKGADRDDEPLSFWEGGDRGVLRRLVPHWLAGPDLRPLVVGFTEARPRHGGEGALYVRLRRRT